VNADVVRKVIAEGVPGTAQPALAQHAGGTLTEAQIDILARGLFSRWAQPDRFRGLALPSYHSDEAGDPERGAAAYQDYCANCHGPEGSGGPNGGSVVDPSYLALTAVIAGRIDLGMPDYRHLVAGRPMTGREITDVVAWLARHRVRLLVSDPGGGER
jgi:mono/diheme cytochrome c family protein